MRAICLAAETTQWIIAVGSLGSVVIALALALGFRDGTNPSWWTSSTAGDNISAERSFVTLAFDGTWPQSDHDAVWQHLLVHGPFRDASRPPEQTHFDVPRG